MQSRGGKEVGTIRLVKKAGRRSRSRETETETEKRRREGAKRT